MAKKKAQRKDKKERVATCCPVCGAPIQMVPTTEMNFRFFKEDGPEFYWRCSKYPACDTYVSADPKTKKPWGTLAGPSLRHKRICIHHWQKMLISARADTEYSFKGTCAYVLSLRDSSQFHTRFINESQCDAILAYFKRQYENNKRIHDIVEANKNSTPWKEVHGLNTRPNHGVVYDDNLQPIPPAAVITEQQAKDEP